MNKKVKGGHVHGGFGDMRSTSVMSWFYEARCVVLKRIRGRCGAGRF